MRREERERERKRGRGRPKTLGERAGGGERGEREKGPRKSGDSLLNANISNSRPYAARVCYIVFVCLFFTVNMSRPSKNRCSSSVSKLPQKPGVVEYAVGFLTRITATPGGHSLYLHLLQAIPRSWLLFVYSHNLYCPTALGYWALSLSPGASLSQQSLPHALSF